MILKKHLPLLLVFLLLPGIRFVSAAGELSIVAHASGNTGALFELESGAYDRDMSAMPIGVFDSGVGGLTVLDAIIALDEFNNASGERGADGVPDFANERFVYLGDQANMPYGNYSAENKTDFLRELIIKDALFLLGSRYWPGRMAEQPKHDKPRVKAIVIACNTATAYGYDDLKAALEGWGLPVYLVGVVNAGAKGALEATGGEGAVGVMATVGTCASEGYVRAVANEWNNSGKETPPVVQQGCLGLAGAIEGDASYIGATPENYKGPSQANSSAPLEQNLFSCYGFDPAGLVELGDSLTMLSSVENYIRYHALTLVENHVATGENEPINAVILGCTHFPFYASKFGEAFSRLRNLETVVDGKTVRPYKELLAETIKFIDPARDTAEELYEALSERGLLLESVQDCEIPTDEFYISVTSPVLETARLDGKNAFTYAYKYGRQQGNLAVEYVRRVPMTGASLQADAAEMVREKLPSIWTRLIEFNARSPRVEGLTVDKRLN